MYFCFFFYGSGDQRDLHVRTTSFPTRRSSDLLHSDSRNPASAFSECRRSPFSSLRSAPAGLPAAAHEELARFLGEEALAAGELRQQEGTADVDQMGRAHV